jgi:hypothetical protein
MMDSTSFLRRLDSLDLAFGRGEVRPVLHAQAVPRPRR